MELLIAFAAFLWGRIHLVALGWSLSWGCPGAGLVSLWWGAAPGADPRALVRMAWEGRAPRWWCCASWCSSAFSPPCGGASGTIAFSSHTWAWSDAPRAFYLAAFLLAAAPSAWPLAVSFGVAGTPGVDPGGHRPRRQASLAVTGARAVRGLSGERLYPGFPPSAAPDRRPWQGGAAQLSAADVADHAPAFGALPGVLRGSPRCAPIQRVDQTILTALEGGDFDLSWTVVLPAAVLLVLPFLHRSARPGPSWPAAAWRRCWPCGSRGRPLAEVDWSCVAGCVVRQRS